jgi:hypothetical protein
MCHTFATHDFEYVLKYVYIMYISVVFRYRHVSSSELIICAYL